MGDVLGVPRRRMGDVLGVPRRRMGDVLGVPRRRMGDVLGVPRRRIGDVLGVPRRRFVGRFVGGCGACPVLLLSITFNLIAGLHSTISGWNVLTFLPFILFVIYPS